MLKSIAISFLFVLFCGQVNAQIMLPAYQGVFSQRASAVASNGLDFDGVDDYVAVPPAVYFNGDFTIECWVYPKSFANYARIIDFGNGANSNNVLLAYTFGTSGVPYFHVEGTQFQASQTLALNQWSHIAATLSGSTATIYINGVSAGTATFPSPANITRNNCYIGKSNYNDPNANAIFDELRIWNIARTQAQIQANMNTELAGTETGLKAYYTFNQGVAAGNNTSITTVTDKTANAVTGTLNNFTKTGTTSNFVLGKVPSINNGLSAANASTSAYQIKKDFPASADGIYWIKNADINGGNAFQIYADMTTDGGGWTLVLNYLHQGGTNPALAVKTSFFPIQGSTALGTDESVNTTNWGHLAPATLNAMPFTTLRFYGKTSSHSRVIHFKTEHGNTISYFKTGVGSMTGIASNFIALTGHTAYIPAQTNSTFTDRGNLAMTQFPFYKGSNYHWGINGNGGRWEVDDVPGNSSNHTFHQIWIR